MRLAIGRELEEVPIVPVASDTRSVLYYPVLYWSVLDSDGCRHVKRLWLRLDKKT